MRTKFTYTGIRVKDLEKSVNFYTKVLGMKENARASVSMPRKKIREQLEIAFLGRVQLDLNEPSELLARLR
jgi:catechol 2,3-dioxygenase-like lactoylglutathione lyase family enzyme